MQEKATVYLNHIYIFNHLFPNLIFHFIAMNLKVVEYSNQIHFHLLKCLYPWLYVKLFAYASALLLNQRQEKLKT